MNKKNSITAFKKKPTPVLPTEVPKAVTQSTGKRGPKPKPVAEKRSHRIMLSITPNEAEKSQQKAGLAGEATAIYAFLHEHGYFK